MAVLLLDYCSFLGVLLPVYVVYFRMGDFFLFILFASRSTSPYLFSSFLRTVFFLNLYIWLRGLWACGCFLHILQFIHNVFYFGCHIHQMAFFKYILFCYLCCIFLSDFHILLILFCCVPIILQALHTKSFWPFNFFLLICFHFEHSSFCFEDDVFISS